MGTVDTWASQVKAQSTLTAAQRGGWNSPRLCVLDQGSSLGLIPVCWGTISRTRGLEEALQMI